ncbi:MAG: hypothetical protein R3C19_19965 [Planctomycetaceae bacterium]
MPRDNAHRPFYRRTAFRVPALCILVCVGSLIGVWYSQVSAVNRQLEELRRQGLPTAASEVNDFYRVPDGEIDTTKLWVEAIDGVSAANLERIAKDLPIIGLSEKPVPPPGQEWEQLSSSRDLLASLESELNSIRTAAAAGGVARYPVDFTPGIGAILTYTQEARQVARLLHLDALVSAHDDNDSRAFEDLLGLFALSDSLRAEPTQISQLVRIAIHAIGCKAAEKLIHRCQWNDQQLTALQRAIGRADFKREMRMAMQGERAMALTAIAQSGFPFQSSNYREALQWFRQATDAYDRPWTELIAEMQTIDEAIQDRASGQFSRMKLMGVLMFMPAARAAAAAAARATARQRCTIIAIAAERYRQKNGTLPESITDLTPELFPSDQAELLIDPFSDATLQFRWRGDELVIYSVGENQKDDNGVLEADDGRSLPDTGIRLTR